MNKKEILELLYQATNYKYPLRWVDEQTTLGDFDGRDHAIDVFNIAPENQLEFLKIVRSQGIITYIFHTPEATQKYYNHLL